jgi:hypothetical protein
MAKHLVGTTGSLEVGQKRCKELAATLWIKLKIIDGCQKGQNQQI